MPHFRRCMSRGPRPGHSGFVIRAAVAALAVVPAAQLSPGPASAAAQERPGSCVSQAAPVLSATLRARLDSLPAAGGTHIAVESLHSPWVVADFYRRRDFEVAWIGAGAPSRCAAALLRRIRRASEDGLEPSSYHAESLERLAADLGGGAPAPESLATFELLLTDGFLTLATHLAGGRVDPVEVGMAGMARGSTPNVVPVLETALTSGAIDQTLLALRPAHPAYDALVGHLASLRDLADRGGWEDLPEGETLRPGDAAPRVAALRSRLQAEGLLAGGTPPGRTDPGGPVFDPALAGAVARFQETHGLAVDSVVGDDTREALNVPVGERIAQVEANLERWRWLPDDLGRRHIRVNVPAFATELWQDGAPLMRMRAVVGRTDRQTPPLSAEVTHLVLAPFWHVPPGIARKDKLPVLKRDPAYLARQRMVLLSQATGAPVDPATVDFAALSGAEFNRLYRIRQDPGPLNALGRVKFVFPNPFDVYMHDTPDRHLFARPRRTLSSGCVRIERPLELAAVLLAGDPDWPPERIRQVADGTEEVHVRLDEPVPVHLLYFTVFVDDDGRVRFGPDVYGRDARLQAALRGRSPAP